MSAIQVFRINDHSSLTEKNSFDVIVVGAGPCGSILAARLAAFGLAVLLVEATAFERQRHGEFLTPQTRAALARLNLLEEGWQQHHRYTNEFVSAWGSSRPVPRNYIFDACGQGLILDRVQFDRQLADAAVARGAVLLTHARLRDCDRTRNHWRLRIEHEGRLFDAQSGFLVLTTGRNSRVPSILQVERIRTDHLVCLGARIARYMGDSSPLVEAYPRGWAYSAQLPNGNLVVMVLFDSDDRRVLSVPVADHFLKEIAECPHTASRVMASQPASRANVTFFAADASSGVRRPAVGSGWCLAGDSAQSVDPLSSGGIGYAIEHSQLIANALINSPSACTPDLFAYEKYLEDSYAAYLAIRAQVYGIEYRWPTRFWQRRTCASLTTVR